MAERLKSGAQMFSDRNGIWTAHKLRNQIAHETDVKVSYDDARRALAHLKRGLKDIGAI
jgi:transposase